MGRERCIITNQIWGYSKRPKNWRELLEEVNSMFDEQTESALNQTESVLNDHEMSTELDQTESVLNDHEMSIELDHEMSTESAPTESAPRKSAPTESRKLRYDSTKNYF